MRPHPHDYSPGAPDLFWLISESPRGEEILGAWHGHATALELARVLWGIDPKTVVDAGASSMAGMTPVAWLTEVLDFETAPCSAGGSGRIRKEGNDYIVDTSGRECRDQHLLVDGRPYRLPKWNEA